MNTPLLGLHSYKRYPANPVYRALCLAYSCTKPWAPS